MNKWVSILCLFMVTFALQSNLFADSRHFSWSYEPVRWVKGSSELEFYHGAQFYRKKDPARFDGKVDIEFEQNILSWWQLGLYSSFRGQNKSTISNDGSRKFDRSFTWRGIKIKNVFNVMDSQKKALGISLYFETMFYHDQWVVEPKIILGATFGKLHVVTNMIFEWESKWHEFVRELKFQPTFGFAYVFDHRISLGVESMIPITWVYSGSMSDIEVEQEAVPMYLGPTLYLASTNSMWLNLNLLTEVTGKWKEDVNLFQARIIVGVRL